jgi:hypothetical protein
MKVVSKESLFLVVKIRKKSHQKSTTRRKQKIFLYKGGREFKS